MINQIFQGDCLAVMRTWDDSCVDMCVTSPPYFGLRSYCPEGSAEKEFEIGLEQTQEQFIEKIVEVFREVRRVLKPSGTLWLNMGDSYAGGLKSKDLMMTPAQVAIALRQDGWWLRDDIIWHKPNPMPSSATDRCTFSYEHVFLLTKSAKYFYDAEAIKEPSRDYTGRDREKYRNGTEDPKLKHHGFKDECYSTTGRNKRNVWTIPTEAYPGEHYATFPRRLVEPCVLAGTSEKGVCSDCGKPWVRVVEKEKLTRECPNKFTKRTGEDGTGNVCANDVAGVLVKTKGWCPTCDCGKEPVPALVFDPFMGSGTVGAVATKLGRNYTGIELNPDSIKLAKKRIASVSTEKIDPDPEDIPLFAGKGANHG